jgi:hypothetical protein
MDKNGKTGRGYSAEDTAAGVPRLGLGSETFL